MRRPERAGTHDEPEPPGRRCGRGESRTTTWNVKKPTTPRRIAIAVAAGTMPGASRSLAAAPPPEAADPSGLPLASIEAHRQQRDRTERDRGEAQHPARPEERQLEDDPGRDRRGEPRQGRKHGEPAVRLDEVGLVVDRRTHERRLRHAVCLGEHEQHEHEREQRDGVDGLGRDHRHDRPSCAGGQHHPAPARRGVGR